jgi:hypothetical protein
LDASRFEGYIDKFYPSLRAGPHHDKLRAIANGLRNGHITLSSLISIADDISLSQEDAETADDSDSFEEEMGDEDEMDVADAEPSHTQSFLSSSESSDSDSGEEGSGGEAEAVQEVAHADEGSGAGAEGTEADSTETEQRGENGCLMHNGQECNGVRAGVCDNGVCVCLGGWTGIRCQNEWAVRRYNPYTGLSEANNDCAGLSASYMNTCN